MPGHLGSLVCSSKYPSLEFFWSKYHLVRQIRISFTITYGNTKQSENSGTERSKFGASKLEMLIAGFNNVGLIKSWGVDSGLGLTSCLFFKRLNVKYFKLLQNLSYIFIEWFPWILLRHPLPYLLMDVSRDVGDPLHHHVWVGVGVQVHHLVAHGSAQAGPHTV